MGKKSAFGQVAPDGSDVCQLSIVCCGEQAGQAVHKALTRYSSWSSRLRKGCKQQQEQQSAAWAWMASRVAQLCWRSSLLLSLTGTALTYHQFRIASTTHKLHWHAYTQGHMHAPIVLSHAFTHWCGCAMGTTHQQLHVAPQHRQGVLC